MGQTLELPARVDAAPTGAEFIRKIAPLEFAEREQEIFAQVMAGNVPNFLRILCPVQVTNIVESITNRASFYVTADYLAVGSDEDYFLAPISPTTAQRLADALDCSLPTRKMVNDIYVAAAVKLAPSPIVPSPAMTTVPVFSNHNATVRALRAAHLAAHPLGTLVAGHKKDVVISAKLSAAPGKVAIYGWHQMNGMPIQPLYLGHSAAWVDYSHGTRLAQRTLLVNGRPRTIPEVLADPALAGLLSDEGIILNPGYPTNGQAAVQSKTNTANSWPQRYQSLFTPGATLQSATISLNSSSNSPVTDVAFQKSRHFGEWIAFLTLEPGVEVLVDVPPEAFFDAKKKTKVLLIFYALPNGNTTLQTMGKAVKPGEDWHYDIQHIGAQTRFLRELLPGRALVVAYLENNLKSWPAWRKEHGDKAIPRIFADVKHIFPGSDVETVLSGHSGGGSLIFGYLNAVEGIPDDVVRIAFLDGNYAYDRPLHEEKLARWLNSRNDHFLCVLAYNDTVARLDGKPFVTAAGGTWGKSHEMQRDLAGEFDFSSQTNAGFERFSALDGRIQFLLKENPEKKILHTVQVERNGFIHSIASGTAAEGRDYEYFGERAYSRWILSE